jgi:hypothetical protein
MSKQVEMLERVRNSLVDGEEMVVGLYNKSDESERAPDAIWTGKRHHRRNDAGLVVRISFKSVFTLVHLPRAGEEVRKNMIHLATAWAKKYDAGYIGTCRPTMSKVYFHAPQETERDPDLKLVDFLLSLIKDRTWEKQVCILSAALEKLLGKPNYEELLLPKNGDMTAYVMSLKRIQELTATPLVERGVPMIEASWDKAIVALFKTAYREEGDRDD